MASWDAQKKEGKLFAYFVTHRDFGPDRTLAKTAQILGLSESYVRTIAGQWNWNDRADQWDAHLDQIARKSYVTELEKQARLRAQAHSALMGVALKVLQRPDLVSKSKLSEASAAVKIATEGMRVEAGLATAKIEIEDVTPDEARRALRELFAGGDPGADRPAAAREGADCAAAGADRVR